MCQKAVKRFIRIFQTDIELIRRLLIFELRRIKGLNKIEIKIPGRDCCGSLVGGPEKKIAGPGDVFIQPIQLMLPDMITGNMSGRIFTLFLSSYSFLPIEYE
jgi:hypothetical protein